MRPKLGRDPILKAALKLFADRGYDRTSMTAIAKEAGVSKGLAYNYFESKEALLRALVDQATAEMLEVARSMGSGCYRDALRAFVDGYRASLEEKDERLRFQLGLFLQPALADIVREPLHRRADALLQITETMFETAGLADSHMLARRLLSELDGIALHHLCVFVDYPLGQMMDQLYDNYEALSG